MKLSVCKPIDNLLNGGLESGCITNFYGPPASGKTNIALEAVRSCIDIGKKAIFVDTEGGFSQERLKQICKTENKKENIKYLENIIMLEPKNWAEQITNMGKIEDICKKENIGLIVVDSVVALWRLEITNDTAQNVNRELATQLSLLSKIAREHNIPIIITNQIYEDIESGKIELSSKTTVKWWSKNLIELMHTGQTSHRYAIIRKARALPEDKKIEFKIEQEGLKKVGKLKLF